MNTVNFLKYNFKNILNVMNSQKKNKNKNIKIIRSKNYLNINFPINNFGYQKDNNVIRSKC